MIGARRDAGLLLGALLLLALPAAQAPPQAQASGLARASGLSEGCPWATAVPSRVNLIRVQAATRCVINRVRADEGLPPLRFNRALGRAAVRHSRDQARRRFCSHSSLDGRLPLHRVLAAGYGTPRRLPVVSEDVACGPQLRATPVRVVKEWVRSDDHRDTLLDGRFVDAGVGIALVGRSVIFTAELGYRP
jgi:uncharacterized protein YkwD